MKNLKFVILILIAMPSILFGQAANFKITYNQNVETYFLAEILAADYRKTNKDFEQFKVKECQVYQPIVKQALVHFPKDKNQSMARLTAQVNDVLLEKYGLGNDNMMNVLLYHKQFPDTSWATPYQFKDGNKSSEENEAITVLYQEYVDSLCKFYQEASVSNFFQNNQAFYNGAVLEFKKHIPNGFTNAMESFYGERMLAYEVLVSPMMPWLIEDGEGRGIGANVKTSEGLLVYEIASPFVKALTTNQYGYDSEFQARFLTIHEFGHSFVNEPIYQFSKRIKQSERFFETSLLKEKMKSYGIANWEVYIIESLVRTGEIEVALEQKDFKRADNLRTYHLKNHFIFIPLLQEKFKTYKSNRKKFPSFKSFLPELLTVFEKADLAFINQNLGE